MATGVLYLDVDDEITTAAARIRSAEGRRVALVLPYGSRVATSRINFRLLARDALTHEKRLSIVAADAATRALAASAGLPVFASVSEYESSEEAPRPAPPPPAPDTTAEASPPRRRRRAAGAAAAGAAAGAGAAAADEAGATSAAPPADAPSGDAPAAPTVSEAEQASLGLAASATVVSPPAFVTETRAEPGATTVERVAPPEPLPPPVQTSPTGEVRVRPRSEAATPRAGVSGPGRRTPIVLGLAVLGLAVVIAGVAAFLFLPSATAVVTPRPETIGPIAFRVSASTSVTEPDVEAGVVPAQEVVIPVTASGTFPATGKRTEEEKAKGTVRFDNLDFTSSNTIPKGSVVSTGSGIRFRTDKAITVPAAKLVGLTVVPAQRSVKVTAVDAGPEGNVEPRAVTTIPRGEEPLFLKVTNPDGMSGGTREEFPRVTQEDVDAAIATLDSNLRTAFTDALDDPDLTGTEATVFPETAALGAPTYSVEPATLVGQEVEDFDLGVSADGTVIAVDEAPVDDIAAERLASSVEAGHELVEDSNVITVDPAVVSGGTISFPVTVTASQVAILDPAALEAEILGLPVADAQAALDAYGTADLQVWPDWVGTVPTFDARVEVTVNGPTPDDEGSP